MLLGPEPEIRIENQALHIGIVGKLLERIAFLYSSLRVLDRLTAVPEIFKCSCNVTQDARIVRRERQGSLNSSHGFLPYVLPGIKACEFGLCQSILGGKPVGLLRQFNWSCACRCRLLAFLH